MVGIVLLNEARNAGLDVQARGDRLVVRGPQSADDCARRLLEHKTEVLAALAGEADPFVDWRSRVVNGRTVWESPRAIAEGWDGWLDFDNLPGGARNHKVLPSDAVCRCGSTAWRDVPIHDGQSIRRDCAKCGRFIRFTVWYGQSCGVDSRQNPAKQRKREVVSVG